MNMKAMEDAVLGEMPVADSADASSNGGPTTFEMPSGAMQPGAAMSGEGAAEKASSAMGAMGEMPGLPGSAAQSGDDMPLGAMTDAVGPLSQGAAAALATDMPVGAMDDAAGMNQALGNAAAEGAVMDLSGQWRMSFWVTPRS